MSNYKTTFDSRKNYANVNIAQIQYNNINPANVNVIHVNNAPNVENNSLFLRQNLKFSPQLM